MELKPAQDLLGELSGVFGLRLAEKDGDDGGERASAPFIDLLVELRADLRSQKLWKLSDQVRDRLAELGVVLEDSKEGTAWHWGK